ncbi:lactate utilization protein [Anaerosphaera multitolerans]|uniref:Lactate utilization protein n=2 Tax=Anaerosphaera multitolerans TaxID=2487351 RepID=A0A437S5Z1_9FIRM|nr:lactate utilization protein [Anaerosphaera multitolerans]
MENIIKETIKNLRENNMNGYYCESREELYILLEEFFKDGLTVGCGDSITLEELGVFQWLRKKDVKFYDKFEKSLTSEDRRKIYLKNFTSDVFITGSNAISSKGEIINIDGNGSRVAPMIYGPKKVIVVVGENKITEDYFGAIKRAREIAAPLDAKRLDKNTPCKFTGKCSDCKSPERICNFFVTIAHEFDRDRIHVLILNENLGY